MGDNWVGNCLQDLRNSVKDRPPSENHAIVSDEVETTRLTKDVKSRQRINHFYPSTLIG